MDTFELWGHDGSVFTVELSMDGGKVVEFVLQDDSETQDVGVAIVRWVDVDLGVTADLFEWLAGSLRRFAQGDPAIEILEDGSSMVQKKDLPF